MIRATLAAFTVLSLVACGSPDPGGGDPATGVPAAVSGEITVFAAASLTETFTELGKRFEQANPEATVTFNFGGSSALAQQINEGAPADVFASASPVNMTQVIESGAVTERPATFARNRLEIVVPAGNPGGITGLADFADESRTIALCAEQVPCGAAAKKAFEAAGITAAPDTLEQDVKAVLTKVTLGEVDAALVYHTDVLAAGDNVEGIAFPEAEQALNDYSVAALAEAPNASGATAFINFVFDPGRDVLAAAGFEEP
jgi:molybdate transport system substrate-binding protein